MYIVEEQKTSNQARRHKECHRCRKPKHLQKRSAKARRRLLQRTLRAATLEEQEEARELLWVFLATL